MILHGGEAFGTTYAYNNKSYMESIFRINLTTGFAELLHQYPAAGGAPDAGMELENGVLYGTTTFDDVSQYGSVFMLDVKTHAYTIIHSFSNGADGGQPVGLTRHGGIFYGATDQGGANGTGTVFTVTP